MSGGGWDAPVGDGGGGGGGGGWDVDWDTAVAAVPVAAEAAGGGSGAPAARSGASDAAKARKKRRKKKNRARKAFDAARDGEAAGAPEVPKSSGGGEKGDSKVEAGRLAVPKRAAEEDGGKAKKRRVSATDSASAGAGAINGKVISTGSKGKSDGRGKGREGAAPAPAHVPAAAARAMAPPSIKAKPSAAAPVPGRGKLTKLQQKMRRKLEGAQFRWLNEQLYTAPGEESFELFQSEPDKFDIYHRGFREQVTKWPTNPLDVIIKLARKYPKSTTFADFGCGEARLAQSVQHKVYSFDLVAVNKHVTACNMTKVPLRTNTVDVAVFCLSLMGTDYISFLNEAARVLRPGGDLIIAEVRSRFAAVEGEEETEAPARKPMKQGKHREQAGDLEQLDSFVNQLAELGFTEQSRNTDNRMFVLLTCKKTGKVVGSGVEPAESVQLKACVYKKR